MLPDCLCPSMTSAIAAGFDFPDAGTQYPNHGQRALIQVNFFELDLPEIFPAFRPVVTSVSHNNPESVTPSRIRPRGTPRFLALPLGETYRRSSPGVTGAKRCKRRSTPGISLVSALRCHGFRIISSKKAPYCLAPFPLITAISGFQPPSTALRSASGVVIWPMLKFSTRKLRTFGVM